MAMVKHRGDTIKSEAIKSIFLYPPFQVGQKKSEHLTTRNRCELVDMHITRQEKSGKLSKLQIPWFYEISQFESTQESSLHHTSITVHCGDMRRL